MIEVPPVVRNKAIAAGADRVARRSAGVGRRASNATGSVRLGRVFPDASEALVAEVSLNDGSLAVLKLIVPRDGDAAKNEITVLRLADGDGCARLLRSDEDRGALLVERLGPSLHDLALPLDQRLEILAAAASRVWRPRARRRPPDRRREGSLAHRRHRHRFGKSSIVRARSERSIMRALARLGASKRTTTNEPSWSTATCTSGTPCEPTTVTSSSTRRLARRGRVRPRGADA